MVHLFLQRTELLAETIREKVRGKIEKGVQLWSSSNLLDPSLFSISLLLIVMWEDVYANLFIIVLPFLLALDVGLVVSFLPGFKLCLSIILVYFQHNLSLINSDFHHHSYLWTWQQQMQYPLLYSNPKCMESMFERLI